MFLFGIPIWMVLGTLAVLVAHLIYATVFNVWHYFLICAAFTALALGAHAVWVYTNKRLGPPPPLSK